MEELPDAFTNLLQTASLKQKQAMLKALSKNLSSINEEAPSSEVNTSIDIRTLVEHVEDIGLCDSQCDDIYKELQLLDLKKPGRGVKTKWLCPADNLQKCKSLLNSPISINRFPNIVKLMGIINEHPSTTGDMNSCLVTRYPSNKATLSLHSDNEKIISQSSSICTVSFGANREIQFVKNGKVLHDGKSDLLPDLVLPAINKSMNIMKPGSQRVMKHAVGAGKEIVDSELPQVRFSLSFRRLIPNVVDEDVDEEVAIAPVRNEQTAKTPKKNIILICGDSFAARLKTDLLGKGKKEVRNIAKGGRKIDQIQKDIEDFVKYNPDINISKLFISMGANDIRYCENGIKHLKSAVCNLMRTVKTILPSTKVWFQSIPPINTNGSRFLERNVLKMNVLIYEMCSRFKLFYLDIFYAFLNRWGAINSKLFPDFDPVKKCYDIHPNKKGMGVLAKFYIYIIHSKWFNPQGF